MDATTSPGRIEPSGHSTKDSVTRSSLMKIRRRAAVARKSTASRPLRSTDSWTLPYLA
jgi:hypothetical protein